MSDRAKEIMADAGLGGRQYDSDNTLVFDPDDPLAPIKEAVKGATDEDLIPGLVVAAVEGMARFGMDSPTEVTVRAYVKKHKLLSFGQFDKLVEKNRWQRLAQKSNSADSAPSADDAHVHTPPEWASDLDILRRMVRTLRVCKGLVGETRNAKLTYLAITSRLLARQVSIVVKGLSASGKSYTVECVVELFPAEAVYTMTAMSERALIYLDEPLSHRTVVLYEATALREGREKAEENQTAYIVRSLLSEGRIEYPTVVRDEDGTLKTVKLVKEGPTNLVTTTTSISLHPENETRMFSLPSDDTKAQTQAVMVGSAAADDANTEAPDFGDWHEYQRWLATANRQVAIPFASCIAWQIPPVAVRLRRDWNAVRALIMTHAVMHQLNREVDDRGRVIATLHDYRAVRALVADLVAEGIASTVPAKVRETVTLIEEMQAPDGVTVSKVAAALKLERSAAQRRLQQARDRGYLVNLEEARGKAARYDLGEPMPDDIAVLPEPDQVCTGQCAHVLQSKPAGRDCECTGVCTCAGDADGWQGARNEIGSDTSTPSAPSADDAHVHTPAGPAGTCTVCGDPLDPALIEAGFTDHGEDPAA